MDTKLSSILREKSGEIFSLDPNASVQDAVSIMAEKAVGCVLIMEGDRLCGLFTERDLLNRVVNKDKSPADTRLMDVATTEIAAVSPDMNVGEAMSFCTDRRVRHLPVYENDRLVGLVSAGDLTKAAIRDQQHTIEDLTHYIYGEQA